MAKLSPADVIKPVPPGISWTDDPRSTPWSTPPKMVNISEIAQTYVDKMSSPDTINSTVELIESEIPLAALANALMLNGVSQGAHTIDAGVLVTPVIIEMLVTLAEMHGVDYVIFPEDEDAGDIPNRVIKNALSKIKEPMIVGEESLAPVVKLSGLMSRKTNNVENM
jgi:hypothetical protein